MRPALAAFFLLLMGACGMSQTTSSLPSEGTSGGGAKQDGGDPTQNDPLCPGFDGSLPQDREACSVPEGTTCKYSCVFATCRAGAWSLSNTSYLRAACPRSLPREGTSCPDCWLPVTSCEYGCASQDAGVADAMPSVDAGETAEPTRATCRAVDGRLVWIHEPFVCSAQDAGSSGG